MAKRDGFTLIEVIVTVAILAIIYAGLMVATNKTIKGWWSLRGSLDLTQKASDAMYWIGQDFRNAKASSMGNIAQNPGLEDPLDMTSSPSGWENSIVLNGYVQRVNSFDSPEVRGGVRSLQLSRDTTAYFSNVITVPETKQYIISGWLKAGGGAAAIDLVTGDKTTVLASGATANNYWVHASTSTVLASGELVRLQLDYSPQWSEDYNPGALPKNFYELCVYEDKLYAVDFKPAINFQPPVNTNGSWGLGTSATFNNARAMAVNAVWLYFAYLSGGKYEVASYRDDSGTWANSTGFDTSFPSPNQAGIFDLCGFKGNVYAGGSRFWPLRGVIMRYNNNGTWTQVYIVPVVGDEDNLIGSLCVYDDGSGEKLYAGGSRTMGPGGGRIYSSSTGAVGTWNIVYDTGLSVVGPMTVYNNLLYAQIGGSGPPATIYNSANWANPAFNVPIQPRVMCSYNNKLYVGGNSGTFTPAIIVYNGASVTSSLNLTTANTYVYGLAAYQDKLYASTGGGEAKIYVLGGENYYDDVSVSPVEVDTTTIAAVPYQYSRATTQNLAGSQWQQYRLRYEPKSYPDPAAPGELYREYSTDGGLIWIKKGLLSTGALCDNVRSFKITNRNQESFTVELILEKEISAGNKKQYVTSTTITPIVP